MSSRVFLSRTEKNKKDKKLVGAHIHKDDANRIALISLEKGKPRSAILLGLLSDFLKDKASLSVMIESAINRALRAWKEEKDQSIPALTAYCKELSQDLGKNRIEKELIKKIINDFRERT